MSRIADCSRAQLSTVRPGRRAGLILLILAAFTAVGTSAWAYWTAPGIGTDQAVNGTLNAPTSLAASATIGSSTVTLTWDGSTLSTGPPAQEYYANRTRNSDGATTAACGSSPTNPTTATSCTDVAVPDGTFHYTVTAVYSSWTATSDPSNDVTVHTATKLVFTTNPSGSTGGISFATQPVVAVQDSNGSTITGSAAPVTLSITTPAGAILACPTNPTNAVSGVATFAGCNIDDAGTYTLTATSGTLTTAVSTSFTITTGTATRLAFTTNPSGSTGGIPFATQPVVAVQDAGGNTTTGTNPVTLTITTPAGAVLTCTANPTNAAAGAAIFAGCNINKTGTFTLTAASSGLTNAVSTSFTITVGPAAKLTFTSSPSSTAVSGVFTTQPKVTVQDAGGNTVTTSVASVTLSITTPAGATLTCTANPKAAVAGVDTFAGCKIDTAGTYTLTATSGALTTAVSASFAIFGPATKLTFTTSPSNTAVNTAFATQPKVTIQDAGGNTVTTSIASVTLSITTSFGAPLPCTANPKAAAAGVDTFAGCKIDTVGNYTLTATSGTLTTAVSASFTISGPATKLAFTTSPSDSTGGIAFATQPVVAVQDADGNTTTGTTSVTLTITTPAGATLICTNNPKNAVAGVVTFAGCKIAKAGTYTLTAASGTLTTAFSTSFTITAGTATKLAFTTSPSASTGGIPFATQPVVTVQDANGNTVTTSAASVNLNITTPAGAVLTCTTNPLNAVSGVATFASCKIDKIGTYTLTATSTGLTNAVSTSVVITVGSAAQLAFTISPSNTARNVVFTTQPKVTVQDAGRNTVTSSTASVTLAITPPAGGAILTCTANPKPAVSGVVAFTGCKIDTTGAYTLTATSGTFTAAVSNIFTIS